MGKSLGQTILHQKGLHEGQAWVWYGLLANAGITCLYLLATWFAMCHIEHHEPISADASPEEAMSSLFSAASFRQPGSARRRNDPSSGAAEAEEQDSGSSSSDKMRAAARSGGSGNPSMPPPIMEDEELKADAGETESWVESYLSGAEEERGREGAEGGEKEITPSSAATGLAVTFETAAPSMVATSISSLTQQLSDSDLGEGENAHHFPRLVSHQASSFWQLQAVSAIPFVPCALSFADVWYSVPDASGGKGKGKMNGGNGGGGGTLDLLKGVSGLVTPGTMMALMGSSGAGACVRWILGMLDVRG